MPEQTLDQAKVEVLNTVNDSVKDLGEGVKELVVAIKSGAPGAWDILVRQHVYDALIALGTAAAVWVVLASFYCYLGKLANKVQAEIDEHNAKCQSHEQIKDPTPSALRIGRSVGLAVALLITIAAIGSKDTINQLVNPEYYAAKDMLHMVVSSKCK
jgi:hypothetical protein